MNKVQHYLLVAHIEDGPSALNTLFGGEMGLRPFAHERGSPSLSSKYFLFWFLAAWVPMWLGVPILGVA